MSLALYVVGFVVVVAGMALAAMQLGVSETWIMIGVIILAGIGIMAVASNLRNREPPGG